ncbi:MAG TPA: SpoIIE family protein phosphatase [Gaiellaceae bacterium]|nr:SpoIIE family protein phosphatase [Gaiellaceae bacterium]
MVVEAQRPPFERLARAAERLASGVPLAEALEVLAEGAAEASGAELAVVRVLDEREGALVARAVAPAGSPRAAELSGSRLDPDGDAPAGHVLAPARADGRVLGAVELVGAGGETARALAEVAAGQLALVLRLVPGTGESRLAALRIAGESLAAGAELPRLARHAVRQAAEATGARRAVLWESRGDGLRPAAWEGRWDGPALDRARSLALEARSAWEPFLVERDAAGGGWVVSVRLGEPVLGVLQLLCGSEPRPAELDALGEYGARLAHALRLGAHARELGLELGRTQALLSVVGEAIAHLSLAHTLETAVDRIADLLAIERVGVYLWDGRRLETAAGRNLGPGHEELAFALLRLAIGPLRARETIEVRTASRDRAAGSAVRALGRAGVRAALGVPLRVHDEMTGLLVVYPGPRRATEAERALLGALAAQLAVAVQNARLHEEAKELGEALGTVLEAERRAARRLRALYEISSTFTQGLSLDRTLDAVAATIAEALGVDAAVIRLPDERGELLVPAAVHVADGRLAAAVRAILERPQAPVHLTRPLVLDPATARRLGGAQELLLPFLAKGSTAAVIPIATQTELLAQLTILSLDPAEPISEETLGTASTIASQAALALDNARLSQQQRAFAETIQRALLPGDRPEVPGLDVGAVYESAARLDVGGDVYDFVTLDGGRVAVVLGDVTGHGVDATADMAMAKFVFRSLVREHPEPADFLVHANAVIAGELGSGTFVTMLYLVLGADGRLACASAGHPAPRVVHGDGAVEPLGCRGLALGVDGTQAYEQVELRLPAGAAVVLYTDGVVEARSGGELYGVERLDACLADRAALPAQALAAAVLADCRAFAGGELRDDCAVVVGRLLPGGA